MKICSRCNAQIEDTADSCSRCGSKSFVSMQQMGQIPQQNQVYNNYQQPQQNWNQQIQHQVNTQAQSPNMYQQPMNQQQVWNQQVQGQTPYIQRPQQPGQNPNVIRPNTQNPGQNINTAQQIEPDPLAVTQKKGFLGKGKKTKEIQPQINPNQSINPQMQYGVNGQTYNSQQQSPYGQNTIPNNTDPLQNSSTDMTVSEWMKTLLLMLIPIYNLIFSIKGMNNVNYPMYKRNYFKAYLIYYLASLGISIGLAAIMVLL